jgi:hypothetical protein
VSIVLDILDMYRGVPWWLRVPGIAAPIIGLSSGAMAVHQGGWNAFHATCFVINIAVLILWIASWPRRRR